MVCLVSWISYRFFISMHAVYSQIIEELRALYATNSFCVVETWVDNSILDCELNITGYQCCFGMAIRVLV